MSAPLATRNGKTISRRKLEALIVEAIGTRSFRAKMKDGSPVKVVYRDLGFEGGRYTTLFESERFGLFASILYGSAIPKGGNPSELRMAEDFAQLDARGLDIASIDWDSFSP